jgi:hypothetical protein
MSSFIRTWRTCASTVRSLRNRYCVTREPASGRLARVVTDRPGARIALRALAGALRDASTIAITT